MAKEAGDSHVELLARIGYRDQRMLREPEGAVELALEEAQAAIVERTPADDHEVLARAWFLIAEAHNIRRPWSRADNGDRAGPGARTAA